MLGLEPMSVRVTSPDSPRHASFGRLTGLSDAGVVTGLTGACTPRPPRPGFEAASIGFQIG